jgi:PII-like signaling protein
VNANSRKTNSVTGYELTFFTLQERRHHGKPLAHWLVEEARALGIGGATLVTASEGFGHHGRIHAMHLFNLSEQPQEVIMAVTEDEANRLFDRLDEEGIRVFYSRIPVEFGTTGGSR